MIQARTLPFRVSCNGALFLLSVILLSPVPLHAQTRELATVIVDASAFLDEIPKGVTLTNAQRLRVPWIFNDTALVRFTLRRTTGLDKFRARVHVLILPPTYIEGGSDDETHRAASRHR